MTCLRALRKWPEELRLEPGGSDLKLYTFLSILPSKTEAWPGAGNLGKVQRFLFFFPPRSFPN